MPESDQDREILRRLAEGLSAAQLRDLFPHREPSEIRGALQRLAGSPAKAKQGPAPPLLFAETRRPGPTQPQTVGHCLLYADGASRGNPGEAGAGAVLLDAGRRELACRSLYLGQCTNNAAEYHALIAGLELAIAHGCDRLSIFLDSELIVRQISGVYKVKNAQLQPLYLQAKKLLQHFPGWRISHVPRAENARADQLANRGIDEKKSIIGADA